MMPKIQLPSNKLFLVNIVSGVALIIAIGSAIFFYNQYRSTLATNKSVEEIESTASAVAKLIELPNEAPTLATVSDVDALKGQEFFKRAQNGDKVLIFKNAQKAILYRPFTNKIIEVGPIKVDEPATNQTEEVAGAATAVSISPVATATAALTPTATIVPSATVAPTTAKISVVVLNGTTVSGLSKKTADTLSKGFSDVSIQGTGNAKKKYTETIVVDLSGKYKARAQAIATFLKGKVSTFPEGETEPNSEIVIIMGTK